MTIPTTYATLQTAIEEDLARTDLTAELPNFIEKGEAVLNRRLRLLSMQTTAAVSLTSSADTASLPAGFLEVIGLRYDSDNWSLTQVGYDDLDNLKSTASGRPEQFAIGSNIEFSQPADQTYALTMRYFKAWDIATDTTNTLLTNHPDLYLYAGLLASTTRTGGHPRAEVWASALDAAIGDLNRLSGRTRRHRVARVDAALLHQRRFDINRGY